MCGIFGVLLGKNTPFLKDDKQGVVNLLINAAQTRGRDSSGIMLYDERDNTYSVFKGSMPLKTLTRSPEYTACLKARINASAREDCLFFLMGHSRLATNGSQRSQDNNQPVVKDGLIVLHNGIVVNDGDLWDKYPSLKRSYEIDTEICPALTNLFLEDGSPLLQALEKMNGELEGTASLATVFTRNKHLALHSNNGSLYVLSNMKDVLIFASEEYPLKKIARKYKLASDHGFEIRHLTNDMYCVVGYDTIRFSMVDPDSDRKGDELVFDDSAVPATIKVFPIDDGRNEGNLVPDVALIAAKREAAELSALLEYNIDAARTVKRCTKCLLPATFPFIRFDADGVCNYCHNYKIKNKPKEIDELLELIAPYRSKDGSPDCIVPFSGGRDSTYALHIIKNELKLNPIAFTYDWGMVTDLGRRNIARVCGKLGVENIIVAADIRKKRRNIQKNLSAWLHKPHLGMIPLLMAGDKYFYYYVEKVKRETGIKLNLWGVNPMENTDFKVGFLGVSPDFEKRYIYSLSAGRKMKLLGSILSIVTSNPRYINSSVWDTVGSFFSRSIMPHRDYFHVFDYFRWDEKEIDELITREYRWEKAIDTTTTWRIGDGTAAFYNYVYFTVAGFSEHDTFRSNQIREGVIAREEALDLVIRENAPRYATIKWYLDIVGLDFKEVISVVNSMSKLY